MFVFIVSLLSINLQAQDNPFFRSPISQFYESVRQARSLVDADTIPDDGDLIRAVRDRKSVHFVSASDLPVVKLYPDDTHGNLHQKWVVQLSNGSQVVCVYNIDFADRVPLKRQDQVAIGGQFIWTKQGGLVHWLHEDPKKIRPDGYVDLDGQRYGQKKRR